MFTRLQEDRFIISLGIEQTPTGDFQSDVNFVSKRLLTALSLGKGVTHVRPLSGFVSTVTATTTVTEDFDQSIVEDYIDNVATFYGVDSSAVTANTIYTTSGTLLITIPVDVTPEEIESAVANSIADSIGFHPSNITRRAF